MATQSVKDILDAEVPPPTFSLLPSYEGVLTSRIESFDRSSVAFTRDPATGRFVPVDADTPRIYGSSQGLLIERANKKNSVIRSSNPADWTSAGTNGVTRSNATSIFAETSRPTDAQLLSGGGSGEDHIQIGSGNFYSGTELSYWIFERGSSDVVGLNVRNNTAGSPAAFYDFDFRDESLSYVTGGTVAEHIRSLGVGPNGGEMYRVTLVYSEPQGDTARTRFYPDRVGSGDVVLHHAQRENSRSATSPLPTDNGGESIDSEDLRLFTSQPSWWNETEGTFVLEVTNRRHYNEGEQSYYLFSGDFSNRILYREDGGNLLIFSEPNGSVSQPNIPPFERSKIAITFGQSTKGIAVNGSTDKGASDGTTAATSQVRIGVGNGLNAIYHSLKYIPKQLPVTQSDRSAGDPVSLETLTA